MADKKVPDMSGTIVATDDVLYIVDTSDITDSADGSSKKIVFSALTVTLATLIGTETLTNKTITSPTITTPTLTGGTFTTPAINQPTIVQRVTSYTPAAAGTATLDVTNGGIHHITMPAGNITIAISNEVIGQCFMIEITQDNIGSRIVTWFSTIKWDDAEVPTLTTTVSKRDVFGFRVTGTDTYDGYIMGQNK